MGRRSHCYATRQTTHTLKPERMSGVFFSLVEEVFLWLEYLQSWAQREKRKRQSHRSCWRIYVLAWQKWAENVSFFSSWSCVWVRRSRKKVGGALQPVLLYWQLFFIIATVLAEEMSLNVKTHHIHFVYAHPVYVQSDCPQTRYSLYFNLFGNQDMLFVALLSGFYHWWCCLLTQSLSNIIINWNG